MIDVNRLFRKAAYEALSGNLTHDGGQVPVYDEKLGANTNNIYVLVQSQSTNTANTFSSFSQTGTLVLQVVHKSWDGVTKDVIEDISNQILQILFPNPQSNGFVSQSGLQILNAHQRSTSSGVVALSSNKYNVYYFLTVQAYLREL